MAENELAIIDVRVSPARIDVNRREIERHIGGLLEPYGGITEDVAKRMDERDLKACRASLNDISKRLNDARKAVKREYTKPLDEFESWCKEQDALIKEPCEVIRQELAERDGREKHMRFCNLYDYFQQFCADNGVEVLAENINLEDLIEPQWLNRSFGEAKAQANLERKLHTVLSNWQTLNIVHLNYREDALAYFWRCLDLERTIKRDSDMYAQRKRSEAINEGLRREPVEMVRYRVTFTATSDAAGMILSTIQSAAKIESVSKEDVDGAE